MLEGNAHKIYLAPMLGITDSAYRTSFMEQFSGYDCAITPFIKTLQGGRCKDSKLADCFPDRNKMLKIFPQILSNCSDDFVPIARELYEFGYEKININFGCPVPMSAGRGRGAGLLPHPDFVDQFLDKILTKIPNQLSIKTRIGFDRTDQLMAMARVFNRYPIFEIAIHPRTAKQGYSGHVDYDAFSEAIDALQADIIYSGDINSLQDFIAVKNRYPQVHRWMLGRGALANPLLPKIIRNYLNTGECLEDALKWESLAEFYCSFAYHLEQRRFEPNVILARLKTPFYYHASHLQAEKRFVREARKTRTTEEFLRIVH